MGSQMSPGQLGLLHGGHFQTQSWVWPAQQAALNSRGRLGREPQWQCPWGCSSLSWHLGSGTFLDSCQGLGQCLDLREPQGK